MHGDWGDDGFGEEPLKKFRTRLFMSKISAVIRAIIAFDLEQMANVVKKGGGDEFFTRAIT
jgi:hypothetical protein